VPGRLAVTLLYRKMCDTDLTTFSLQAADILMHSDTLASYQIKHVIYAGHAWHQRERGRKTANLATVATVTLVP
jgi:hypothetical protein